MEEILAAMKVRAATTAETINSIIEILGAGVQRSWAMYYPLESNLKITLRLVQQKSDIR